MLKIENIVTINLLFIMTNDQIQLVQQSWASVVRLPEVVGPLFYGRLFEIAPELKPMFSKASIPEQSKKLFMMLNYVITKLSRLEEVLEEVSALAKRHVGYGVQTEHYTTVGQALLWTLEKGLGDKWTEDLKAAWTECYTVLSSAMIGAAAISS
jgi:nitric oxide dioxygenase